MKFLEYAPLSRLSSFLNDVDVGDCIVKGELEAYSCKLAGQDKKISRALEQVCGTIAYILYVNVNLQEEV